MNSQRYQTSGSTVFYSNYFSTNAFVAVFVVPKHFSANNLQNGNSSLEEGKNVTRKVILKRPSKVSVNGKI
jgi:hypothetical protein